MASKLSADREGPAIWLIVDMERGLGGELGGARIVDEAVVKGLGERRTANQQTQPVHSLGEREDRLRAQPRRVRKAVQP